MSTHRQQQQSDQEQKRTWFSRRKVVIATIVILALLITTAWILSILNVIPATWAAIITAVLTVATAVFTLVAAFPSFFGSEKPEQHTTSSNTTEKARLVILDQFETLLDSQSGHVRADRPGVGELIDAFNSQPCRCRVLLTSRLWPTGTREYPPACMQEYAVKGLESAEGIELLRKQGVAGTDDELRSAVSRCDGHALSLTLLAALLRSDRSLNLQALLTDPLYARLWTGGTGKVAQNLLDYIYTRQLDEAQRQLLLAFSVYREPVPLAAVEPLLRVKPKVAEDQLLAARDVLLAQHLLQAMVALRYQLHAIVASYARDHFDEQSREANQEALRTTHAKAAQYYMQQAATDCLPRKERRRVSDSLYNNLGAVYDALGQKQEALRYYEQALAITREVGDRGGEGSTLWNIGALYFERGRNDEALACFPLARDIYEEVLSPNREGCRNG